MRYDHVFLSATPMRIALVPALALPLLLQGCLPIPHRTVDDRYFHVPTSAAPLQTYSNGAVLSRYFTCTRFFDGSPESCDAQYLVLERGAKPDWQSIALSRENTGRTGYGLGLPDLQPVLSAFSGTTRRVIGPANVDRGFSEIMVVDYDAASNAKLAPALRRGELTAFNLWSNGARCKDREKDTHPRLVVEDEESTWIFVDLEPGCKEQPVDRRVPAEMMEFDHPERFAELLHRPMHLLYMNRAKPDESDGRNPRFATSYAPRLKREPRNVIAIDSVPVPKGKVFTLEYNEFREPLDAVPHSNLHCRYSELRLYDSIFRAQPSPSFDWCRPIRK